MVSFIIIAVANKILWRGEQNPPPPPPPVVRSPKKPSLITKVLYKYKYKFKREFYVEKILSSCDLTDKCLSRNYNMDTYILNEFNRKGKLIFCSTDK